MGKPEGELKLASQKKTRLLVKESEELKSTLNFYKEVLKGTKNVFYKFSSKKGGLAYSSNMKSVIGYSVKQLEESPFIWLNSIHKDDRDFVEKKVKTIKLNEKIEIEYRFVKPNNKIIWLRDTVTCVEKKRGEVIVQGFAVDITEAKDKETEVEKNKHKYEDIFNQSSDGIVVSKISANNKITVLKINSSAQKITGYTENEIAGKNIVSLFSKKELMEKPLRRDLLLKGEEVITERHLKLKNRKEILIEMRTKLMPDNTFITVFRDISERIKAQEVLANSEMRYRSLVEEVIESAGVAIFILDADYNIVWVNNSVEKFFGLKKKQLIGKNKKEILKTKISKMMADPSSFISKIFLGYKNNVHTEDLECRVLPNRKRKERWLLHWSQPISKGLYKNGRIEHYTDITKQKNIEDELKETERFKSTMLGNLAGIVYRCKYDKNWTMEYLNETVVNLTGYEREELIGNKNLSYNEIIYPDDRNMVAITIDEQLQNTLKFNLEYRIVTKKGDVKWVWEKGTAIKDEDDKVAFLEGYITDITDRKKALDNLHLQSQVLLNMQEGSSLIKASDGTILFTNPSFNEMFGYKNKELIGKYIGIIDVHNKRETEKFLENISKVIRKNNLWEGEILNKRKDGSTFWTYTKISSFVHSKHGKVFVSSQSDISTEKEYEITQAKEQKRLQILYELYTKTDTMNDDELYQFIIDKAVDLTDSKIGFFHRLAEDQKTIILTAWSSSTLEKCDVKFDSHYPLDQAGNWVECVRQQKPIVYNNFKNSPHQKGLPQGHAKVNRMISVPVIHEDKVKFIFGVGNKEFDYSDNDVLQIQLVSEELRNIIANRRVQSKIKISNERLKEAEKIGGIGYFYIDLKTQIVEWSDQTYRIFERDKALGTPNGAEFNSYIHPDDFQSYKHDMKVASLKGKSFFFEFRIVVNSKIKYVEAIGKSNLDSRGKVDSISGIMKDVTEYKIALNSLKENEEKFEKAFKTSPDAIAVTRIKDGQYIDVNESFKRILGYEREEMIGKSSLELDIWRYEKDRKRLVDGLMEKGYVENLDAEYLTKYGGVIYGLMSARIIKFGSEDVILSITRDITDRRAIEKALKESELKHRKLISNISDVIVIINKEGKISYKSSNIEEHFGWKPEELIGKDALYTCHPDDYERIVKDLQILVEKNNYQVTVEFNYLCKDGSYKPIELTAVSLIDDPVINGIIANYRDISERKKAEKIVVETQRLGAIGEMSSAIAHDFNNSLQSIFGNLELAKMNLEEEHQCQRFLDSIKIATTDAATRVKLLQRFAGTSKMKDEYSEVNLNQIVKDVVIQSRPMWKDRSEKEGLKISMEVNYGDIKPVLGNEGELRSVLYNMIKNSVEAMPHGGRITISTYLRKNLCFIVMNDEGTGMNEETKSRIFQPFFTTKGFESGRGMGMSGSYSIIKEHNGNIYVQESILNKGTSIVIEIPIMEERNSKVEPPKEKVATNSEINILWIDDEAMIREIAKEMIEVLGYHGKVVSSGNDAIDLMKTESFDLVLTDIGMPDINGWKIADHANKKYKDKVKIGVVTGWGDQISQIEMQNHHVDFVLPKPFGIKELKDAISEVMD